MAAALRLLIEDAPRRERLGQAGRARFERDLDIRRSARALAALYGAVIEEAGGGRRVATAGGGP